MLGPQQARRLRAIVTEVLGAGWRVQRFGDEPTDFEVTSRRARLAVDAAWQLSYRLRAQPGVAYAEPLFQAAVSNRVDWGEATPEGAAEASVRQICSDTAALPESADHEWSIKQVRVPEAWQDFFGGNAGQAGAGILVGHPDTGYRRHPELVGHLRVDLGFDFVDGDPDAEDELVGGPLSNPGHGAGTGSVILSPRGGPAGVSGVAPGARLIPLRVSPSVVLLSTLNLAHAIEHATRQGAHVISISMGGLASWRLRQAVVFAQKHGVIVAAAAGNCVRFVVWPAAYAEVAAVAACNARLKTWPGSSRGAAVDLTAPGESVWKAGVTAETGGPLVDQGTGTSYAVATVAGAAALWLARHGRAQLVQRYGAEKLPFIFNQVLRGSCAPVSDPSWTPGQFGAGLLDVHALLSASLPDLDEQVAPAPGMFFDEHVAVDAGGLDTFAHLFEASLAGEGAGGAAGALEATLAELLRTAPAELRWRLNEVGQELAFHVAADPRLYRQLAAAIAGRQAAGGAPEAAAPDIAALRAALRRGGSQALRAALEG